MVLTTIALFPYADFINRKGKQVTISFIFSVLSSTVVLCAAENPTLRLPESSLMLVGHAVSEKDEIKIIDQLITSTQQQLEQEKKLRDLMLQFKDQIEEFVQGKQTKSHAGQMVRTARQIYEMISANHIEHLFTKEYLDELTFFSSIAGKNGISRP